MTIQKKLNSMSRIKNSASKSKSPNESPNPLEEIVPGLACTYQTAIQDTRQRKYLKNLKRDLEKSLQDHPESANNPFNFQVHLSNLHFCFDWWKAQQASKTVACPHCTRIFRNNNSLNSHLRIKHADPKVLCLHCNEVFHTASQRNAHFYDAYVVYHTQQNDDKIKTQEFTFTDIKTTKRKKK